MTRWVATVAGRPVTVEVDGRDGRYRVSVGDDAFEVDARRVGGGLYSLLIGGASHVAEVESTQGGARVDVDGASCLVTVEEHARHVIRTRGAAGSRDGRQAIASPLPGKVTHVAVAPGDQVKAGDTVVVIEAMKMENEFKAGAAGTVTEVRVRPGQAVNAGDLLVLIEESSDA